jgi:hypothetical protein
LFSLDLTRRAIDILLYCSIALVCASGGQHNELANWAKRDCDDSHAFVIQTSHARNAHEVAAAMRENVRRQRETIQTLLQFVRSHPELRVAAELGLSEEGQQFWRDHRPSSVTTPSEVTATGQQLTACVNRVDTEAQKQMVSVLREYNTDAEVLSASQALHQMWTENDQALLRVLLQQ